MNASLEQSLLSELRQICSRLGDVVAGIHVDPGDAREKIDTICDDLTELRGRMVGQESSNT